MTNQKINLENKFSLPMHSNHCNLAFMSIATSSNAPTPPFSRAPAKLFFRRLL
jgi:hypothetical protein